MLAIEKLASQYSESVLSWSHFTICTLSGVYLASYQDIAGVTVPEEWDFESNLSDDSGIR